MNDDLDRQASGAGQAGAFTLKKLTRAFAGVAGLYVIGVPLTLLASIILARMLTVADFGVYGFAISLATVLAIPVSGGLPMLLTREVAGFQRDEDWSSYRGILVSAYSWVIIFAVLVALGLAAWILWAGDRADALVPVAFIVPLFGLAAVRNGLLKGLGHPVLAEAPTQVLQPILLICGFLALAYFGLASARAALWWYVATFAVVFVVATATLLAVQPSAARTATASRLNNRDWVRALLPFAMLGAVTTLGAQIGVLLLGFAGMEEAVAQLRVAERGAQLVAFPLTFINAVLGPYLVNAYRSGDLQELKRVVRFSAWLTLAPAVPTALILWIFGPALLALTFGAPYDALAYGPMMILITAQVVSLLLGNGGMLLAMSGHERYALLSMVFLLLVTASLAFVLIPKQGATGAAIAVAAGIFGAKFFVFLAVKRKLGIWPGPV